MGMETRIENPKQAAGEVKPSIHMVPMGVFFKVIDVFKLGATKYGLRNWRKQPIRASAYHNAMFRHMMAWYEHHEEKDKESGHHHLTHVVANALIVLDALEHGSLIDDREVSEVIVKQG